MSTDSLLYKRCETCAHWASEKREQGVCILHDRSMSKDGHCAGWKDVWTTLRYVLHNEIATYLSLGWVIRDDLQGTHHGFHAIIMEKKDDPEES